MPKPPKPPQKKTADSEAKLKRELVPCLEQTMPKSITVRVEDRFRAGIPDIIHTWSRMTSFIEVKYADPELTGRDVQWETCMKLAEQGSCWYVIYTRNIVAGREVLATFVVSPFSLTFPDWRRRARFLSEGHNHQLVAEWFAKLHSGVYKIDK